MEPHEPRPRVPRACVVRRYLRNIPPRHRMARTSQRVSQQAERSVTTSNMGDDSPNCATCSEIETIRGTEGGWISEPLQLRSGQRSSPRFLPRIRRSPTLALRPGLQNSIIMDARHIWVIARVNQTHCEAMMEGQTRVRLQGEGCHYGINQVSQISSFMFLVAIRRNESRNPWWVE